MRARTAEIKPAHILAFVVRTKPGALRQDRFELKGAADIRIEIVFKIERCHDALRDDMFASTASWRRRFVRELSQESWHAVNWSVVVDCSLCANVVNGGRLAMRWGRHRLCSQRLGRCQDRRSNDSEVHENCIHAAGSVSVAKEGPCIAENTGSRPDQTVWRLERFSHCCTQQLGWLGWSAASPQDSGDLFLADNNLDS